MQMQTTTGLLIAAYGIDLLFLLLLPLQRRNIFPNTILMKLVHHTQVQNLIRYSALIHLFQTST